MKNAKDKKLLIEQLRKMPIIQIACERVGIARATYYRWLKDPEFKKAVDEATAEGESLINDMSESQIIALIRDKNWSAISFWLRHHHPKYADKLQISGYINNQDESLSLEQEKLLREALALVSRSEDKTSPNKNDSIPEQGNDK